LSVGCASNEDDDLTADGIDASTDGEDASTSDSDTVPLIIWSVDAGALHDGVGTLISVNDASTVDGTSICDGGGSWFDGIDALIGDNNASASDIIASIPVDAGASSDGPGALISVVDAPMADASSAGDEGSSTDCIVNSIKERNELPELAVGAEPSTTSSSTLAKVDSIVTAGLGAERDPTHGAQKAKLAVLPDSQYRGV
jgi:hypothetical protein